ncbi:MAG: hypothetical protein LBL72_06140 [Candidatus Accumulibacter sp.]|jgi:hypothetical protein|nr:hypothetical protein [Accumulibacter sp.]
MSEYQYYEFAAIDRPLTRDEICKLRAVSTRAVITPTGFNNHYEWGDLKADPADWMRLYFDAFVYWADWCSCWLVLRFPKAAFHKADLEPFTECHTFSMKSSNTHWLLEWSLDESEDYERFAEDDGRGWMRRLLPLRDELLRGDLRSLYLGWLAGAKELDDGDLEPPPPSGLKELSPAQEALAEFLGIDPDLLEAASSGSASMSSRESEAQDIAAWLETWRIPDMQDVVKRIALGQAQEAEQRVKSLYAAWLKAQHPVSLPASPTRCVAELCELARSAAAVRQAREAKERAAREAKQRQRREADLRRMMDAPDERWKDADTQATRGGASGYDEAVRILTELAEGYALVYNREAFDHGLRRFLVPHAKRAALLRRLADAGLWSG